MVLFALRALVQEGEGYELRGKAMRSAIITALSALAVVAIMPIVASAQIDQSVANPSYERANQTLMPGAENSSGASSLTAQQENEIPYHPCTEAVGWVNGRLVCRNY